VLDGNPAPLPQKGAEPPIFGPLILWPNGCMYQDTTWYGGRPQPRQHCVRWGPSSPPLKGHSPPNFRPMSIAGQTAGWTKMPLGMEVGLGLGVFVFDGNPAPHQKKGTTNPIFGNVSCSQTTGWIKMPLGTEVNLGLGDGVLDGVAAPTIKVAQPPVFGRCILWPNGWMDEDATWYGSRPRPRPHCVRRGPSSPLQKGQGSPLLFLALVYCGHGRPSQLLPSSCLFCYFSTV